MSGDEWMLPVAGFGALLFVVAAALVSCGPAERIGRYPVTAHVVAPGEGVDLGVSVDAGRVDFGRLPAQRLRAEKTIRITNNRETTLHATVAVHGNVSTYLDLSTRTLTVPPGETGAFTVTMQLTNATRTGRYGGAITVTRDPCAS